MIAIAPVVDLSVEAGRTLRWPRWGGGFGWYDLSPRSCPRPGYTTLAADGVVAITHRHYGYLGEGTWVLRGCDAATRRDRVISQHADAFPDTDVVHVAALQGRRALLVNLRDYRYDDCYPDRARTVDALTGRGTPWAKLSDCSSWARAAPKLGDPVAITASGAAAWVAGGTLVAVVAGKLVTLDSGGAIADLQAQGEAVAWTRDGAPRSAVPAG